jgi:hypothetical protein
MQFETYHLDPTHRDLEAQGHFSRRIGESIELPNAEATGFEPWSIVDTVHGDDHAPVILRSRDGRVMTIPARHLLRYESAARNHASDGLARVISVDEIARDSEAEHTQDTDAAVMRLAKWGRGISGGAMMKAFGDAAFGAW